MVGTPIAGRPWRDLEGVLGCFLNNLALRLNLSGNPTFEALLDRVRQVCTEAYAHQDVPFEHVLEHLAIKRDPSRSPVFQVFLSMLEFPEPDHAGSHASLTMTPFGLARTEAKFDLTLYVREQPDGLHLALVYNTDLCTAERMKCFVQQFHHLLTQLTKQPGACIGELSLVTPQTARVLPQPTQPLSDAWVGAIHRLFAEQAQRVPQQLAVRDPQGDWTYAALEASSNQLAHDLRSRGIRNQDVVAIYGYRSAALVWAVLGVLKAGAAFLILDPLHPAARLRQYLELAQPAGWLQLQAADEPPEALAAWLTQHTWRCHRLLPVAPNVTSHDPLYNMPNSAPEVEVGPDDLACVAFTSGSTGQPKGVLGRHGPLTHFVPWLQQQFAFSETDRFSMLSGLSHDPLQRDIFPPLQLGATICIPAPETIRQPGQLAAWMQREAISVAHLTPALGSLLTVPEPGRDIATVTMPALRRALFVGDVLTRREVDRLQQAAPNVTCINLYGTTETQRALAYHVVAPQQEGWAKEIIPLGQGMPDAQLLVLNAAGQLAGVSELGEIYVRSPHLARGYLGSDDLTQERFLANPFTNLAGDRLYRTGDLGRYRPDGLVESAGRADAQVQIRGFRVEPGEVQAMLERHPAVRETVVVARDVQPGDTRLLAYVVPHQAPAPSSSTLRSFLLERLPAYMAPAAFVPLPALPLTPNRKVDQAALPAPDWSHIGRDEAYVAPQTPLEAELAEIWADVLGCEKIGVRDDCFVLGGHSLLAVQLLFQVQDTFQVELPLESLFASPTVADMALAIVQRQGESVESDDLMQLLEEL